MQNYLDLVKKVIEQGEVSSDRTGTGTRRVFGGHIEFDLRERFPLVTAKETRWRTAFLEMLWFLRGERDTSWLNANGCKLWDDWAKDDGWLGPIYGAQWRDWAGWAADGEPQFVIDQITTLIGGVIRDPYSRRHLVSAWNVAALDEMALPPCHFAFQCFCSKDGHLDMQVYQRSWDLALGAPFNIAQYALLLELLARATWRKARKLSFAYGDAHVYENHVEAMKAVVAAGPAETTTEPRLVFHTTNTFIDGYKPEDFGIVGYQHRPFVKLEVSV
jgi:thymidylate synthase